MFVSSDQINSFYFFYPYPDVLLQIKPYLHGFFYSPKVFFFLLDFSTMKVIFMQHTANCLVTHSFPCSIFNNSTQFRDTRGTQPRIFFSYFIKYVPFFSSTLWFSRLILYGSSIFKLINNLQLNVFYWQVVLFWADNILLELSLSSSAVGLHHTLLFYPIWLILRRLKVDWFVCQCTDTAITRNQAFGAESMPVNKNRLLGAEVYGQKSDVK